MVSSSQQLNAFIAHPFLVPPEQWLTTDAYAKLDSSGILYTILVTAITSMDLFLQERMEFASIVQLSIIRIYLQHQQVATVYLVMFGTLQI
jgi:hypothetical protein